MGHSDHPGPPGNLGVKNRVKPPFARFLKAHHISHAALTAGVLVAALVFFMVGAGVRLLVGPVSLGPLRGPLAAAIQSALPGIALDYDQAAIEWDREQGRVNLVVLGTRIYDGLGRVAISAPKADIDLAAAPLLSGKLVVRRITLVGVGLTLVHTRDGNLRLGLERDKSGDDLLRRLSDVFGTGGGKSALESFAVRDGRLTIMDEASGLAVVASRAVLRIGSQGPATTLALDAEVAMSGYRSHLTASLLLPPGNAPFSGDLTLSGLDVRALAANSKRYAALKNVALIARATVRFAAKQGGGLARAAFDITATGDIPAAWLRDKALHVRQLRLGGHYQGNDHRIILQHADLDARQAHVRGSGGAELIYADGALAQVRAYLTFPRLSFDAPGLYTAPVAYQGAVVEADYQVAARRLDITRFAAAGGDAKVPGFALDASGAITLNDTGAPGLSARAHIGALPIRALLHYWPVPVARGAREWIDNNIFAGQVGPLEARADFAPGVLDQAILPEDSVNMTFSMRGLEGTYIRGLTRATGVDGEALLTGDTFRANFSAGRIGAIVASAGSAVIPALHKTGTVGQFNVHVAGVMPDIMRLIDMSPLNYARKFGIDPAQTGGNASADLSFQVPMLADLPMDDVAIAIQAKVEGFAVTLGRIRLHDGSVAFDIDNAKMHQTGTVGLADSRLTVDWSEDFRTRDHITSRLTVKGKVSDGARTALGIGLERYFKGTVPVTAQLRGHRGALATADVTLDLTPALLTAPIVNLQKEPGQAASGRVLANFGPGNSLRDESITITGPVLNATGTAVFAQDGGLTGLSFPTIRMGTLNDLAFQMRRTPAGTDYTIRGRAMDGSHIGHKLPPVKVDGKAEETPAADASADEDTPKGPFRVSMQLQRLALRGGVVIAPFSMELAGVRDRPSSLSLNGTLTLGSGQNQSPDKSTASAPLAANIAAVPEGRRLTVTAGNAGLLARGMFGFESMRGGALDIAALLPGRATDTPALDSKAPDFTGTLVVTNFRMVNQSLLARLFSAGSLTGLGDLLGGDGMSLDRLEMPFSSKNNVISVNGARVSGSAIGASADGYIDRPKGVIALKGSLVPAFGLNSIISNVPLLGDILASRKGEGIFGVTYSMTGDAEHPNISTNPLSILTPGILRRIFEGHIPTAANAPTNVQDKALDKEKAAAPPDKTGPDKNQPQPDEVGAP